MPLLVILLVVTSVVANVQFPPQYAAGSVFPISPWYFPINIMAWDESEKREEFMARHSPYSLQRVSTESVATHYRLYPMRDGSYYITTDSLTYMLCVNRKQFTLDTPSSSVECKLWLDGKSSPGAPLTHMIVGGSRLCFTDITTTNSKFLLYTKKYKNETSFSSFYFKLSPSARDKGLKVLQMTPNKQYGSKVVIKYRRCYKNLYEPTTKDHVFCKLDRTACPQTQAYTISANAHRNNLLSALMGEEVVDEENNDYSEETTTDSATTTAKVLTNTDVETVVNETRAMVSEIMNSNPEAVGWIRGLWSDLMSAVSSSSPPLHQYRHRIIVFIISSIFISVVCK